MTRRPVLALAVRLAACLLVIIAPHTSGGAELSRADSAGPSFRVALSPDTRNLAPSDWDALNLGIAVDQWVKGDLEGAAASLSAIDISPGSSFEKADRAAFMLAVASLLRGDVESFHRVADRAAADTGSPYRRWIRYCQLVEFGGGGYAEKGAALRAPTDLPGADILTASLLIEAGHPHAAIELLDSSKPHERLASIHWHMTALARQAAGEDAASAWRALAERKPRTRLESDLIAGAILRLASMHADEPADALDWLEKVADNSRHAPRARHMIALIAAESGDTERARQVLVRIPRDYPAYVSMTDIDLALGGLDMDVADWPAAIARFESAQSRWQDEYDAVATFEDDAALDDTWRVWQAQHRWHGEIRLAPEALLESLARLARASLDLRDEPPLSADDELAASLWPADAVHVTPLPRHAPSANEWESLRLLKQQRRHVASVLVRQERLIAQKQAELARRLSYLQRGLDGASASADGIADAVARLESILSRVEDALLQMDAVRDSALVSIATRTGEMTEMLRRELLFIDALRHFHVDGPARARPDELPPGIPTPGQLLDMEVVLAQTAERFLTFFETHYSRVIDRSFSEIWEPRLTRDSRALHAALLAELARARRIGAAVDSTMAWHRGDPDLERAVARRDELAAALDSLRVSERELKRDIAHAVAERARRQLTIERQAIDYHLADAAYELAVSLATDPATAEEVAQPRQRAIAHLETFLSRYPESIARGESRYRLADLFLMKARDDFQKRMAGFLDDAPAAEDLANRALAPFVDYAPAIKLYEAILAEDRDFPHIDAVLFNLGMILSDDGQTSGATYLARLVEAYPESPDCQEAWLRLGNDLFEREEFAASIPRFENAVTGDDASFTAIALYKLGWAHFEEDRFDASADAFRRLIDHFAVHGDVAHAMGLRDEAEEYLVHSLARAGGASAFRDYFDAIGGRDYESGILLSLGHLMLSVSLYEEAVESDALWLSRYPRHAKALAVAERLVDSYKSWNKPQEARQAKLRHAEHFLPGGAWLDANRDPASRSAAREFAQAALRESAAWHHREARNTESATSWKLALDQYERYLEYWPDATDSPRIHFMAGEAAAQVHGYARALAHFESAAAGDADSLATEASWQIVAVTDAWYRTTRESADAGDRADSLATRLTAAADRFAARYPQDERAPDIVWRRANVAYAHRWYTQAATHFALFAARYSADPRTTRAVRLSGDAYYSEGAYDDAGAAYETALSLARAAGHDSLVAEFTEKIPLCYYKHAESVAASDDEKEAAPVFARVAERWPEFAHADRALYRAGLGYVSRGSTEDATAAWERLLARYPQSEYARDSAIEIAKSLEASGNKQSAASAYERFSRLFREDPDAPEALLKAIDLLAEANDATGAETMRGYFVERFPGEVDVVMEIRAKRAERDLTSVESGAVTLSSLLAAGSAAATKPSDLQAYLALAEAHPDLASPEILAQVDYLEADAHFDEYAAIELTQPLPEAIEKKKAKLEALLALYDACTRHKVAEYSRASAFRIGQALIEFGDALMASERPNDLGDEDLLAYEEVIEEQSWEFYERGAEVWSELLKQIDAPSDDPGEWITRTREALWPRLGQRFLYRPEVEYPLVVARPPADTNAE